MHGATNDITLNGHTFTGEAAAAIREWSRAKSNEIASLESENVRLRQLVRDLRKLNQGKKVKSATNAELAAKKISSAVDRIARLNQSDKKDSEQ